MKIGVQIYPKIKRTPSSIVTHTKPSFAIRLGGRAFLGGFLRTSKGACCWAPSIMLGDIDAGLSLASKIGCNSEKERRGHGSETNVHLSVDGKLSLDWIGARLAIIYAYSSD